ncbi:isochorismatase family protein [Actinocorallia populi]|uniref:isochorismatase family protein n=1 Tax=Actinocorallia populi TaxID=2079200 RepID=UPI0018E5A6D3|nr:isochorismatase family protein [Actinocorallia populi]
MNRSKQGMSERLLGEVALVIQECQKGVIGPDSLLPLLAEAAAPVVPNIAALAHGARQAGIPVVHAIATTREDGYGEPRNAPLFAMAARAGRPLLAGTPAAEVLDEIGLDDRDLVLPRRGGLSPIHDTGLVSLLRNLGIRTVVVAGVSVNVAILDLVLGSVNAGFSVTVPRDAVAGVPSSYAESVIDNTFKLLADVVHTKDVLATWTRRE